MILTGNQEIININWDTLINGIINWCTTTGVRLIVGVIALIISFKIVDRISKRIYNRLHSREYDETIVKVISYGVKISLKILLVLTFVGFIGIETASITAAIASMGIALGLALQGALSNVAGGILIVFTRPFRIGDFITSNGESGTVENIKLIYTEIVTPDNKVVHIPNGNLANNVIVNFTAKDIRRVDMVFSVGYDADFDLCRQCFTNLLLQHDKVLKDKEPFVAVKEHADSYIDFTVRCWCKKEDYWNIYWYMMEKVPGEFERLHIDVPYNKVDVTIVSNQ